MFKSYFTRQYTRDATTNLPPSQQGHKPIRIIIVLPCCIIHPLHAKQIQHRLGNWWGVHFFIKKILCFFPFKNVFQKQIFSWHYFVLKNRKKLLALICLNNILTIYCICWPKQSPISRSQREKEKQIPSKTSLGQHLKT